MPSRRTSAAALALMLALGALGACSSDDGGDSAETTAGHVAAAEQVGGEAGTPVGDAAVDAVLGLLEAPPHGPFTATYALVLRLGNVASGATVADDGAGRRSVTVGDVRFVVDADSGARTCRVDAGTCEDGLLDARTSDLGFGAGFAAETPARRLRIAWSRRSGDPVAGAEVIAGQPATCVTVPVAGGAEVYCALDSGVVARWTAADVVVDLESFAGEATEDLFAP